MKDFCVGRYADLDTGGGPRINGYCNTDGGAGSGNFGHEGRPGHKGGSLPNGGGGSVISGLSEDQKTYIESENTHVIGGWGLRENCKKYLKNSGVSGSTLKEMDALDDNHEFGDGQQKRADYKISTSMAEGNELGKALQKRSEYETALYDYYKKKHGVSSTRIYRKGDRKEGVECWTTDPEGADMGNSGHIGYDHASTIEQLQKEGYQILAGIGIGMGAPGEGEVTMVKPTKNLPKPPEPAKPKKAYAVPQEKYLAMSNKMGEFARSGDTENFTKLGKAMKNASSDEDVEKIMKEFGI